MNGLIDVAFAIKKEALEKLSPKDVQRIFGDATERMEDPAGTLFLWEQVPQTRPTNCGLGHVVEFAWKHLDRNDFLYISTVIQSEDGRWESNPWGVCCQMDVQLVVDNRRWPF